jgi:ElaB/YqjD/DUF883 family membrane-anchored ribosome-binding protein
MDTRKVKKAIRKNIKIAQDKSDDMQKIALQEYAKMKKEFDSIIKKADGYVKKNPKKVALFSAGIGAALGAISGALTAKSIKKKK